MSQKTSIVAEAQVAMVDARSEGFFLSLDTDELGAQAQVWRQDADGTKTLVAAVGAALGETTGSGFDPFAPGEPLVACSGCGTTRIREEKRPRGWTTDFESEPRRDYCSGCSDLAPELRKEMFG